MQQIISRQEPVKTILRNKTIHEWMCFESESIVKHNWTDVAVHDRKILNKMRCGDTRLWHIHELGSLFLPMYCMLHEKQKQEEAEYEFSSVEIHAFRLLKEDRLGQIQAKIMLDTGKFYFITKGGGDYDYSVVPADFGSVLDLIFCGKANFLLK
jgi:hypothetical protein